MSIGSRRSLPKGTPSVITRTITFIFWPSHLMSFSSASSEHRGLIRGRQVADVIRDNIQLTNIALKERVGVEANGFRTPGGFTTGLHGREDLQQLLLGLGFDWISSVYPAHAGIVDIHGSDAAPAQDAYDNILAAQPAAQPLKVSYWTDRNSNESNQRYRRVPQRSLAAASISWKPCDLHWIG